MRTLTAFVLCLCLTVPVAPEEFDPFAGPRPLAVFIQSDPWLMVIGSDTPRVAIYDDGEVVFTRLVDNRRTYHHVRLDAEQLGALREKLEPVLALKDIKPYYDVAGHVTDQPEAMLHVREGDREVTTTVYGLTLDGDRARDAPANSGDLSPPAELLALHRWLSELDFKDSAEWIPKYVEVMLWDYSYAPDASIRWPEDWPSLDSNRSRKRGDDFSIFLDGALLPRLRDFLSTRSSKGAVEIEGRKMAAAYRFTFPGEPAWRKAFAAAATRVAPTAPQPGRDR